MVSFLVILGFLVVATIIFNWLILRRLNSKKDENEYGVLHQRLDSVTQLILNQLQQNRESTERSAVESSKNIQNFVSGVTQLQESVKNVHESMKGVVSFQNIFKSPKLRGQWGETSLESVLGQYFPKELFSMQYYFKSGEAVDAILRLPNERLLPIDSKFNWENFEKMINAENDINKEIARKAFVGDVKKKIDEIAGKYILPSEDTVDMALMYVPAESVYYEIAHHIKEVDISAYARSKKVILVSPNTLYLTLSAIQYWFRDIQITKQTQEIIKRLARINQDAVKLGDSFQRLGKHISDAKSSYDDSEKRLDLMKDRIENVVATGEEAVKAPMTEAEKS
ncbi:MAG: DNA recombination protein RmuC [Candidatus Yanofskybacteria bacterium]|nr:DNA recombination protein RmuC [Candidatus Yanofskybacteria bacterium]